MSLKTENSRRVAKSRPVCMGLKCCVVILKLLYSEKYLNSGNPVRFPLGLGKFRYFSEYKSLRTTTHLIQQQSTATTTFV
jgi:hypothetical protein